MRILKSASISGFIIFSVADANKYAYHFWREKEKILQRIKKSGHRTSLEMRYYEVLNQPNVNLIDVNEEKIIQITKKGIKTSKCEIELDITVFAIGFDAISGGLTQIDTMGTKINSAIVYCKEHNYTRMQPTHESEVKYTEEIGDMADKSLLNGMTSFFMGANIPGKRFESLNYLSGVPSYYKKLKLSIAGDFKDFKFE
ncbi:uncharacterized protein V1518DRAFT_439453 [Limtongia smithiae]|uniref:uncharacterized protein n=1 Tax=Limtongia smithiae TaxID=1125753 RepID=UPI0034CDDBA5